jgi:hypothetical protein
MCPPGPIDGCAPVADDDCGQTALKNAWIAGFCVRQSPSGSTWCDWTSKMNSPGRFFSVSTPFLPSHSRSHGCVVAVLCAQP